MHDVLSDFSWSFKSTEWSAFISPENGVYVFYEENL